MGKPTSRSVSVDGVSEIGGRYFVGVLTAYLLAQVSLTGWYGVSRVAVFSRFPAPFEHMAWLGLVVGPILLTLVYVLPKRIVRLADTAVIVTVVSSLLALIVALLTDRVWLLQPESAFLESSTWQWVWRARFIVATYWCVLLVAAAVLLQRRLPIRRGCRSGKEQVLNRRRTAVRWVAVLGLCVVSSPALFPPPSTDIGPHERNDEMELR